MLKKYLLLFAVILFGIMLFVSCSGESVTTDPPADPEIDLIFPNGGDTLQVGVPYTIKWSDNISDKVDVEIYRGLSSSAVLVEEFTNVSGTECQFTVPVNWSQTADYKVRINSVADTSIYDISDDYFRIAAYIGDGNDYPSVATDLTIPHKGNYAIYGTGDVDWYRVYLYDHHRYHFSNSSELDFDSEFYLYRGNAAGTDILFEVATDDDSGGNAQPYLDYSVTEEGYYFLRVAYYSNNPAKTKQVGTGYYTLNITEHLFLEEPNGGEVWMKGTQHDITWDAEVPGNVDLSLVYEDGYVSNIATVSAALGSYTWTLPSGIYDAANYKIRVANHDNPDSYDESDEIIMICSNLTEDVVGDWDVSFEVLKWDISFELYNDGTGAWGDTFDGHWTLTGNGLKFTVDAYPNNFFLAIVDGNRFEGNFYDAGNRGVWSGIREGGVTNPDDGEVYSQGDVCEIRWEENLSDEYVKIDIYNEDVYQQTLFSNTLNDGFQTWTIPSNFSTGKQFSIRVSSISDSELFYESEGYFTIQLEASQYFSEDFSDGIADNWVIADGIWNIDNEILYTSNDNYNASSCYYDWNYTGNYSVEARIQKISGSSVLYGIFVNGDHIVQESSGFWENYVMLVLDTEGHYYLQFNYFGAYWGTGAVYSDQIAVGYGQWNDLRLDVNNSTGDYDIYINGVYISTVNTTHFTQGEIGLLVYDSDLNGTGAVESVSVSPFTSKNDIERKYIRLKESEMSTVK